VQARDSVSVIDGVLDNMSVVVGVLYNTISIDIGDIDPTTDSWLFIMRNGIVIITVFLGVNGNQTKAWQDMGINPSTAYTYEAFIWTAGITGGHWRVTNGVTYPPGVPNEPNPPDPDLNTPPRFINNTPDTIVVAGEFVVRLTFQSNISFFARMWLERSGTGTSGWSNLGGPQTVQSGNFYDTDVTAKWYRLRAEDTAGTQFLWSQPIFWPGLPVPPGGGNNSTVAVFSLGVALRFGLPRLVVSWTCANPDAVTLVIQTSPNDSSPWTDVYETSTIASGSWALGNAFAALYYRIQCKNGVGGVLSTSPSQFHDGLAFT
jgi:hypothetical protein